MNNKSKYAAALVRLAISGTVMSLCGAEAAQAEASVRCEYETKDIRRSV